MAAREIFGNRRIAIFVSDSFLRSGGASAMRTIRCVTQAYSTIGRLITKSNF
jgi:hypothetical protein